LIEWAKSNPEVEKIELNVRSSNLRAIRLYQKLGFNIEGRIRYRMKMPDGSYQDDLEMGLFVGPGPLCVSVSCLPIGVVISSRREPIDDDWDRVESQIKIDETQFTAEALSGLTSFSHIEVLFQMNQVDLRKIEMAARHPRNNQSWPQVGIFSQRGKNRPNQLGLTICKVVKVEGLHVWVKGLDAVDGSPVLDIKPWVTEFGPRGDTYQPEWISELMRGYWQIDNQ
jgi:tRNA-Thr(GGU) m(6)t(6)A37 methyltransferase TsaA